MANEMEDIPQSCGMKILRNVPNLESRRGTTDIVIRAVTIPFWQACIQIVEDSESRTRVCVVGTPGIGKSSSTPLLIHLLLARVKLLCTFFGQKKR
jgi:predicted GTPase